MERLSIPQGDLTLRRYPARTGDPLRAWDAADELLLHHVADGATIAGAGMRGEGDRSIVIVNDAWGALSTALAPVQPVSLSDSYCSHAAIRENLGAGDVPDGTVALGTTLDPPPPRVDVLLMKVPKELALLEDQLHRLAPSLHEHTAVVVAGMARHIHRSTLDLLERIIGPTRTSRAEKKARLAMITPEPGRAAGQNPWPATFTTPGGLVLSSHAGTFSPRRFDAGSRLLVEHLTAESSATAAEDVVDLGCGNGVVGLSYAAAHPRSRVTFIDESFRAVASAAANVGANLGDEAASRMRVVAGNGLFDLREGAAVARGSIDLVLNNPPFHADHAVSDATAWQMFTEAHAALRPGGAAVVVGNRHLGYHTKLARIFGNCDVALSNAKYVVLRAVRS